MNFPELEGAPRGGKGNPGLGKALALIWLRRLRHRILAIHRMSDTAAHGADRPGCGSVGLGSCGRWP
jgi:hypothetical protein